MQNEYHTVYILLLHPVESSYKFTRRDTIEIGARLIARFTVGAFYREVRN